MLVFTDDMENLIRDAVEHQTSLTIDIGDHMQLAFYPDPHGEADAVYALADLNQNSPAEIPVSAGQMDHALQEIARTIGEKMVLSANILNNGTVDGGVEPVVSYKQTQDGITTRGTVSSFTPDSLLSTAMSNLFIDGTLKPAMFRPDSMPDCLLKVESVPGRLPEGQVVLVRQDDPDHVIAATPPMEISWTSGIPAVKDSSPIRTFLENRGIENFSGVVQPELAGVVPHRLDQSPDGQAILFFEKDELHARVDTGDTTRQPDPAEADPVHMDAAEWDEAPMQDEAADWPADEWFPEEEEGRPYEEDAFPPVAEWDESANRADFADDSDNPDQMMNPGEPEEPVLTDMERADMGGMEEVPEDDDGYMTEEEHDAEAESILRNADPEEAAISQAEWERREQAMKIEEEIESQKSEGSDDIVWGSDDAAGDPSSSVIRHEEWEEGDSDRWFEVPPENHAVNEVVRDQIGGWQEAQAVIEKTGLSRASVSIDHETWRVRTEAGPEAPSLTSGTFVPASIRTDFSEKDVETIRHLSADGMRFDQNSRPNLFGTFLGVDLFAKHFVIGGSTYDVTGKDIERIAGHVPTEAYRNPDQVYHLTAGALAKASGLDQSEVISRFADFGTPNVSWNSVEKFIPHTFHNPMDACRDNLVPGTAALHIWKADEKDRVFVGQKEDGAVIREAPVRVVELSYQEKDGAWRSFVKLVDPSGRLLTTDGLSDFSIPELDRTRELGEGGRVNTRLEQDVMRGIDRFDHKMTEVVADQRDRLAVECRDMTEDLSPIRTIYAKSLPGLWRFRDESVLPSDSPLRTLSGILERLQGKDLENWTDQEKQDLTSAARTWTGTVLGSGVEERKYVIDAAYHVGQRLNESISQCDRSSERLHDFLKNQATSVAKDDPHAADYTPVSRLARLAYDVVHNPAPAAAAFMHHDEFDVLKYAADVPSGGKQGVEQSGTAVPHVSYLDRCDRITQEFIFGIDNDHRRDGDGNRIETGIQDELAVDERGELFSTQAAPGAHVELPHSCMREEYIPGGYRGLWNDEPKGAIADALAAFSHAPQLESRYYQYGPEEKDRLIYEPKYGTKPPAGMSFKEYMAEEVTGSQRAFALYADGRSDGEQLYHNLGEYAPDQGGGLAHFVHTIPDLVRGFIRLVCDRPDFDPTAVSAKDLKIQAARHPWLNPIVWDPDPEIDPAAKDAERADRPVPGPADDLTADPTREGDAAVEKKPERDVSSGKGAVDAERAHTNESDVRPNPADTETGQTGQVDTDRHEANRTEKHGQAGNPDRGHDRTDPRDVDAPDAPEDASHDKDADSDHAGRHDDELIDGHRVREYTGGDKNISSEYITQLHVKLNPTVGIELPEEDKNALRTEAEQELRIDVANGLSDAEVKELMDKRSDAVRDEIGKAADGIERGGDTYALQQTIRDPIVRDILARVEKADHVPQGQTERRAQIRADVEKEMGGMQNIMKDVLNANIPGGIGHRVQQRYGQKLFAARENAPGGIIEVRDRETLRADAIEEVAREETDARCAKAEPWRAQVAAELRNFANAPFSPGLRDWIEREEKRAYADAHIKKEDIDARYQDKVKEATAKLDLERGDSTRYRGVRISGAGMRDIERRAEAKANQNLAAARHADPGMTRERLIGRYKTEMAAEKKEMLADIRARMIAETRHMDVYKNNLSPYELNLNISYGRHNLNLTRLAKQYQDLGGYVGKNSFIEKGVTDADIRHADQEYKMTDAFYTVFCNLRTYFRGGYKAGQDPVGTARADRVDRTDRTDRSDRAGRDAAPEQDDFDRAVRDDRSDSVRPEQNHDDIALQALVRGFDPPRPDPVSADRDSADGREHDPMEKPVVADPVGYSERDPVDRTERGTADKPAEDSVDRGGKDQTDRDGQNREAAAQDATPETAKDRADEAESGIAAEEGREGQRDGADKPEEMDSSDAGKREASAEAVADLDDTGSDKADRNETDQNGPDQETFSQNATDRHAVRQDQEKQDRPREQDAQAAASDIGTEDGKADKADRDHPQAADALVSRDGQGEPVEEKEAVEQPDLSDKPDECPTENDKKEAAISADSDARTKRDGRDQPDRSERNMPVREAKPDEADREPVDRAAQLKTEQAETNRDRDAAATDESSVDVEPKLHDAAQDDSAGQAATTEESSMTSEEKDPTAEAAVLGVETEQQEAQRQEKDSSRQEAIADKAETVPRADTEMKVDAAAAYGASAPVRPDTDHTDQEEGEAKAARETVDGKSGRETDRPDASAEHDSTVRDLMEEADPDETAGDAAAAILPASTVTLYDVQDLANGVVGGTEESGDLLRAIVDGVESGTFSQDDAVSTVGAVIHDAMNSGDGRQMEGASFLGHECVVSGGMDQDQLMEASDLVEAQAYVFNQHLETQIDAGDIPSAGRSDSSSGNLGSFLSGAAVGATTTIMAVMLAFGNPDEPVSSLPTAGQFESSTLSDAAADVNQVVTDFSSLVSRAADVAADVADHVDIPAVDVEGYAFDMADQAWDSDAADSTESLVESISKQAESTFNTDTGTDSGVDSGLDAASQALSMADDMNQADLMTHNALDDFAADSSQDLTNAQAALDQADDLDRMNQQMADDSLTQMDEPSHDLTVQDDSQNNMAQDDMAQRASIEAAERMAEQAKNDPSRYRLDQTPRVQNQVVRPDVEADERDTDKVSKN